MLWRVLSDVESGFYIDVGAAWPREHSVTKAFYDRGWQGINIEPNPEFFSKLEEERERDINLACALSSEKGVANFNIIKGTGLSTLDASIAEDHKKNGWGIEKQEVPVSTLRDVWEEYVPAGRIVHFLKIDVEGLERAVLMGNDWRSNRPWIILVETTKPLSVEDNSHEWEPIVLDAGYELVYEDGLNRFYLERDKLYFREKFRFPPNTFDDFALAEYSEASSCSQDLSTADGRLVDELRTQLQASDEYVDDLRAQLHAREESLNYMQHKLLTSEKELQLIHADLSISRSHLSESEARLSEANDKLYLMENSISWFLTKPLRKLNPKTIFRYTFRNARIWISDYPRLKVYVKKLLALVPGLSRCSAIASFDVKSSSKRFAYLEFEDGNVAFCMGPLKDRRGIGRVSQALFENLCYKASREFYSSEHHKEVDADWVHFYSSIHWCPDELPENSVVMIHDVIPLLFPDIFPEVSREWNGRFRAIAQKAGKIITISKSSAADISRLLDISLEKIEVVYNGVVGLPVLSGKSDIKLPDQEFLVFFGSHDFHKNVDIIFSSFRDQRLEGFQLLMIGDNERCRHRVFELGLEDRVKFLGRLSDEEAGYVISKALVLLFPSLYEGFGLPPFEAALLGTPSICSRRPAMTELLDGAVLFADPYSEEEWIEAILKIKSDSKCRATLSEKGRTIAEKYRWELATEKLLESLC